MFRFIWAASICKTLTPHLSLQGFNQPKGKGRLTLTRHFQRKVGADIFILRHFYIVSPFILTALCVRDFNSHCRAEEKEPLIHLLTVPPPASGGAGTSAGLHGQGSPGRLSFESIWFKASTCGRSPGAQTKLKFSTATC